MMPIDYGKYPAYWRKLSKHIRHVRAGNRCEWCNAPNGDYIVRSDVDPARYMAYDADHHAQNAARTRAENKRRELREAGQLSLFEEA